jgi:hypothetical protein
MKAFKIIDDEISCNYVLSNELSRRFRRKAQNVLIICGNQRHPRESMTRHFSIGMTLTLAPVCGALREDNRSEKYS